MTLIYPEGNVRSFDYNQDLSRFVDAWLSEKIEYTSIPQSALFEHLRKNAEIVDGGDRLAWSIFRTDQTQGASPFFNIYNSTTDTVTATEPDQFIRLETDFKNAGQKVKLNKIRMQQASGKAARQNYVKETLTGVLNTLYIGLGRATILGNPALANQGEFTGIANIIGYTGTYGGKARTLSRGLVGNVFDAANVTTASAVDAGWDVTYGSAQIDKAGHGLTAVAGDLVDITDARGVVRTYVITVNNTNDLQIAPAYEGATDTGLSIRVYSPYEDTAVYGAAGELTWDKIDFASTMASDGNDVPDLLATEKFSFHRIRSLVAATERSITMADLKHLGVEGKYESFLFNSKPVIVDNHINRGDLFLLNTKYLKLHMLENYDKPTLTSDGLMPLVGDSTSYQSVVGEVVVSGDLVCNGVNRQARITGIVS